MLEACGAGSADDLFSHLPEAVRLGRPLNLAPGVSEYEIVQYFRDRAAQNGNGYASFLGAGVYHHFRPVLVDTVVSRGEFLTSYTPYQAEISQGTLTTIFEFQTMICQLTGMDVANASMYDGSSAVPEAAMRDALSKFESKAKADMDKTLADNKREGDAFMAANRSKKGVIVLPGDVQYRVIEEGTGKAVTAASEVTFHIRVSNSSGRELQSSFVGEPVKAKVADMSKMFGPKVPDVVQKMKVGDHWTIYLPPDPNTGNQVLVLEIKIIDVK